MSFELPGATPPPESPADPHMRPAGVITLECISTPVVSEQQVVEHLRLDGVDAADLITLSIMIEAATEFAEEAMACSLRPRTMLATFYAGDRLILRNGPIISVDSVRGHGDTADRPFRLQNVGNETHVGFAGDAPPFPVSVTYRAGHAVVPALIRLAILQHVATMFENRESVSDKTKVAVPHSLADFYKLKRRAAGVA